MCREHVWDDIWRIASKWDTIAKQRCVKCGQIRYSRESGDTLSNKQRVFNWIAWLDVVVFIAFVWFVLHRR